MFDISGGQKTLFFKKCPNNGLVSEKKYIEKFSIVGGGRGSDPSMENSILFFFFFFEGFPKIEKGLYEEKVLLKAEPVLLYCKNYSTSDSYAIYTSKL